eukprot:3541128-Prymnesium_polylepis.2
MAQLTSAVSVASTALLLPRLARERRPHRAGCHARSLSVCPGVPIGTLHGSHKSRHVHSDLPFLFCDRATVTCRSVVPVGALAGPVTAVTGAVAFETTEAEFGCA